MSCSVDVNVLLYASDDASPLHARARSFLEERCTSRELFYLPWPAVMSYLRIATHPRIFTAPLSPAEALSNVEMLARFPHVRFLSEGDGFLQTYREVMGALPARGNLVPDAHLAAILRQHGVRVLYTRDADFRKFPFLDVRDPFAGEASEG